MSADKKILAMLDGGMNINSTMIQELLDAHSHIAEAYREKYEKYKQEKLEIQSRVFQDPNKLNNKIANDYRSTIIDQVVGYMFGTPIVYGVNEMNYSEQQYREISDHMERFLTLSDIQDLDSETGKICAICGRAYRLCYIDDDGDESITELLPWEVIALKNNSRVKYALRYYEHYNADGKESIKVEFYDDTYIYTFTKQKDGFVMSEEPKEHLFHYCPVVEFENNKEVMGDFDRVETLIDAYDRLMSDNQNELEEFRQAYMIFDGGAELEKEDIIKARQSGAFTVPDGCKPYFLTKSVNSAFNDEQRRTLEENIYKFSKSVNMSDEKFSGSNQSGESRKWKLIDLENKAITKERKYSKSLKNMFRILCSAWNVKGLGLDYLDIYYSYTRTLPIDLSYYGEVASKFKGILADKTVLELIPVVDDAEYELELQAREAEQKVQDQIKMMNSMGGLSLEKPTDDGEEGNTDYQFGGNE